MLRAARTSCDGKERRQSAASSVTRMALRYGRSVFDIVTPALARGGGGLGSSSALSGFALGGQVQRIDRSKALALLSHRSFDAMGSSSSR